MFKRLYNAALYCPHFILMMLGAISVTALTAALISQYGFNMRPCEFCIYQRIPYAVVILLAILGVVATKIMGKKYGILNIAMCGIAFFINSIIAFIHVGIEQGWWSSGCSLPDMSGMTPEEMMTAIRNAPTVSCSDIPFELFGISMAGFNVIICFGLAVYCVVTCFTVSKGCKKECHDNSCC